MIGCLFYGFLTSVIGFGYTLILYALGYHGEKIGEAGLYEWLGHVIIIIGLILAIRKARKKALEDDGSFSYGHAFMVGFATAVVVAVGSTVFTYIYAKFINPGMVDAIINLQRKEMRELGVAQEQISAAAKVVKMGLSPLAQAFSAFVGTIFLGIFSSLILGIVFRNYKENEEKQMPMRQNNLVEKPASSVIGFTLTGDPVRDFSRFLEMLHPVDRDLFVALMKSDEETAVDVMFYMAEHPYEKLIEVVRNMKRGS